MGMVIGITHEQGNNKAHPQRQANALLYAQDAIRST